MEIMKHHLSTLAIRYRVSLATWLFRMLSKIELFQFKQLLRSRDSTLHLIRLQLRNHFFPTILEGDDEKTDRIVWLSTLYLIDWKPNDRAAITAEEETQARSIVSDAYAVHGLADSLSTFLGLGKLIHQITGRASSQGAERILLNGEPVLPKEILQKDMYRKSKKLQVEIKSLRRTIADRKGERIALDFLSISQGLSLISVCFLLTGYLYSSIFLAHFGIPSTQYFNISDYLATSLDKVQSSFIASVGALIGLGMGLLHRSRMSEAQLRSRRENNPEWVWQVVKAIFIVLLIVLFFMNREQFYRFLPVAGVFLFLDVLLGISYRYFHQPVKALFALAFVSLYSLAFFSSIQLDFERIKTGTYWKQHSETLKLSSDMTLDASNLLLLYASGGYFFMLQKDSGTPVIIPRDNILQVEINKPLR